MFCRIVDTPKTSSSIRTIPLPRQIIPLLREVIQNIVFALSIKALALILGGLYLIIRRVISWKIPAIFIGTVFLLSFALEGNATLALYETLGGGVIIAAFFMATDYVTTPINKYGKMIFAFGCGLITVLIRFFGAYPEGVSFAILFMNILSPYIEKWTHHKALGGKTA